MEITCKKPSSENKTVNKTKADTIKNGKLKYKASFVVTQLVMPEYEYRELMVMINFKENDLTSESNYDRDFKINPVTGMTNVVFQKLVIF
jgi:hypothetical protein